MVYLAEHPALAALEVRVHLDLPFELLPNDFVLMHATLPDALITGIDDPLDPSETVTLGNAWLAERRSAALRVPSMLMPYAWNVLINPRHPDASRASVAGIEPFHFDPRLWQPLLVEG